MNLSWMFFPYTKEKCFIFDTDFTAISSQKGQISSLYLLMVDLLTYSVDLSAQFGASSFWKNVTKIPKIFFLLLPIFVKVSCLSSTYIAVIKHLDQKQLGKKNLYFYKSHSVIEESQGRNLRLELKQKPWRSAAYRIVPCCLLRLLSYTTQDTWPELIPSTMFWVLLF